MPVLTLIRALVDARLEEHYAGRASSAIPGRRFAPMRQGRVRPLALSLGRRCGTPGDAPLRAEYGVEALGDGRFTGTGPFYLGSRFELGPMALLRCGGVRIAVASRKQQAADQAMFIHVGVEPAEHTLLLLEGSVHFRADFGAMASRVLVVAALILNVPDPARLPFVKLQPGVRLTPHAARTA